MRSGTEGISERLYRTLFLKKEVALDQNLYTKYYSRLWPCEQAFISFLRTENSQEQLECAIAIVEQLSFDANFPLPGFVFKSLISSEHRENNSDFIAQDHAIHSVNLYILGLYLYFNHNLFHIHLTRYFETVRIQDQKFGSPLEQSAKAFFSAWRIFALYHDIGYVLERATNNSGYLNPAHNLTAQDLEIYSNLCDEVLYETLVRSFACSLYANMIFQQSKTPLSSILSLPNWSLSNEWYRLGKSHSAGIANGNIIKSELSQFGSFVRIFNVDTWKGLKYLLPFIDLGRLVTFVKDRNMHIVAISYTLDGKRHTYAKVGHKVSTEILSCCNCLERLGSDEFPAEGYTCEHYVPSSNACPFTDFKNKKLFLLIATQCRKKFGAELFMSDSAQQADFRFKIYRWLQHQAPFQTIAFPGSGRRSHYDVDVLDSCIKSFLCEKVTRSKREPGNNLEREVDRLIKKLQSDLKNAKQEIMDNYSRTQNADLEKTIALPLQDILIECFNQCKSKLSFPPLLSFGNEHDKYGKRVLFHAMSVVKRSSVDNLYNNLSALAEVLKLNIDDLFKYRPSHSKYDHGVVSGALVARTYTAFQQLCNNVNACPLLRCAWPVNANDFNASVVDKDSAVITHSIFAILLHNIYVKKYNKTYGINYMQDISINPFSYFCALCDSLQFWNRPKLINQARTRLPEDFSTGRNFDLWVEGGKIHLDCNSAKMRQRVKSFDDYLSAASSIVVVLTSQEHHFDF